MSSKYPELQKWTVQTKLRIIPVKQRRVWIACGDGIVAFSGGGQRTLELEAGPCSCTWGIIWSIGPRKGRDLSRGTVGMWGHQGPVSLGKGYNGQVETKQASEGLSFVVVSWVRCCLPVAHWNFPRMPFTISLWRVPASSLGSGVVLSSSYSFHTRQVISFQVTQFLTRFTLQYSWLSATFLTSYLQQIVGVLNKHCNTHAYKVGEFI